jgi:hypothetical protein
MQLRGARWGPIQSTEKTGLFYGKMRDSEKANPINGIGYLEMNQ